MIFRRLPNSRTYVMARLIGAYAVISLMTSALPIAQAGLIAHYALDEAAASGNPVADSAGANSGSLINAARVTQGVAGAPFGTAYDFEPTTNGGGVNLGTSAAVRPTDDFTMTFWFQADVLNAFDRLVESMDGTAASSRGYRLDLGPSPGNHVRALLRDGTGS